jgi:hypothetical protein
VNQEKNVFTKEHKCHFGKNVDVKKRILKKTKNANLHKYLVNKFAKENLPNINALKKELVHHSLKIVDVNKSQIMVTVLNTLKTL